MVFVNKSLEEMLVEIQEPEIEEYHYVVPDKERRKFYKATVGKNTYLDFGNYAFTHDILQRIVHGYQKRVGHLAQTFALILENAFTRGNQADMRLPVSVKTYKGKIGHVISIMDSGDGFDYKTAIEKVNNKRHNAQGKGKGLRMMRDSEFQIAYAGSGSIVNVLYITPYKPEFQHVVTLHRPKQ
ncbi:MAG: hypothetical protein ACI8Y7_000777 [Candidatus Woesearchaeota archaeon]|jgi:hypothetical protein